MPMSVPLVVDEVLTLLRRRFGSVTQVGRSNRLWRFGNELTCSVNYSKVLRGNKFFFGLSQEVATKSFEYPKTTCGDFVLLICGSAQEILVIPRRAILEMLEGVPTRKLDVFREGDAYVLQTTRHPKLNVTEYLNAYPERPKETPDGTGAEQPQLARDHVKYQSSLIDMGRAEGCLVWVPPPDRSLSYQKRPFADRTLARLPNFGFDENTRRIVQNIDVLWLAKNVILRAFEIEASTTIYSGLLRFNDLVLAQPNNHIHLCIVASRSKRLKVMNQLIRPSFQSLIAKCTFSSFEDVDDAMERLKRIPVDRGAKVTGLLPGEQFRLPDSYIYPTGV